MAAIVAAAVVAAVASAASKPPAATFSDREPAFCKGSDIRAVVDDFVTAFNHGDTYALSVLWVRVRYLWYAVDDGNRAGEARNHIEFTRLGALRYFADRHRHGERLRLSDFRYIGFSAAWGHFRFRVQRRADDLNRGRWADYGGVGRVSCLKGPVGLGSWTMLPAAESA